jgi:hypothetical protein
MVALKRNSFFLFIFLFFISGCSTSSFFLLKQDENAAEFKVTPDRILLECEYQFDNDTKDSYGFLMHVLDDENTVITVAQMNILDSESCLKRIQKIKKILSTGKIIYVGGMGYLTEPRRREEKQYTFPHIGTFHGNGRTLQFIVIANEQGLCYDAYSGEKKPCPAEPFSLKSLT